MRLLQVTTISETLEAFLLPFATHFRGMGWVVEAAARGATSNESCISAFDQVHDIGWSRSPLSTQNIRAEAEIHKLLDRGAYDIVHIHTPVASFVTRLGARRLQKKPVIVYTAHGFHFHDGANPALNFAYQSLERVAGPLTDELVVINKTDYEAALSLKLVPSEHLSFIPGTGFNVQAYVARSNEGPGRDQLRASLRVPRNDTMILMVAEFTANKRHLDAVEALARLRRDGRPTHLVLAGVGPSQAAVKKRVAKLGLTGLVHFLGFRRDVPQLLKASDALLLVSEREGLPRSVMEAMAVGVPVIGTAIRGVLDLLSEGAGILVPVRDVNAIANAMATVVSGGPEVNQLIKAALRRVDAYSLQTILASYEKVYERALKPKSLPASEFHAKDNS